VEKEAQKIFSFVIQDGVYEELVKILQFPVVTGPEINGQVCRVTTQHDLELSIKQEHWKNYKQDKVVQVRLLNNDTREFVVMGSMLTALPECLAQEP
jgi:hypothetical protein